MAEPILFSNFFEKRKSIENLVEESRADGDYFLFLIFAAFITTLGLLIDNPIVIVGAMLVAPILFPLLALGMGIVTTSQEAIVRSLKNIFKSIVIIVIVSLLTAFIINKRDIGSQLLLSSTPNFIFFLIAFFSGVVASFSWVKQNVEQTLPGVAVTVTLLPPLSALGVSITFLNQEMFSGSLLLFVINLLGIVLASVVMFSLFGFSSLSKLQDKKIEEEEDKKEEKRAFQKVKDDFNQDKEDQEGFQ